MKKFKEIREKYVARKEGERKFVDMHKVDDTNYQDGVESPLDDAKKRKQAKRKGDKETIAEPDAVKEEVEPLVEKNVVATLQDIVKNKQAKSVKFDDGSSLKVDGYTASALVQVYDKVNDANKQKMGAMLEKDKVSFMKLVDFAFSKTKK